MDFAEQLVSEVYPELSSAQAVGQLHQQVEMLKQQINQLVQQRGSSPSVKVTPPDAYFGDKSKVDTFIFQHEMYFNAMKVYDDASKVNIAASNFRGPAINFWMQVMDSVNKGERASVNNWNVFCNIFRKRFQVINPVLWARNEIANTTQTDSVSNYVDRFTAICNQIPDMSEADKTDRFIRGCKSYIQKQIRLEQARKSAANNSPLTLSEAINLASCLDDSTFFSQPPRSTSTRYESSTTTASSDSSAPMDLGAMQQRSYNNWKSQTQGPGKFQKLTPEVKEELIANNACFYCRKPGHRLDECRSYKQKYPNAQRARQ